MPQWVRYAVPAMFALQGCFLLTVFGLLRIQAEAQPTPPPNTVGGIVGDAAQIVSGFTRSVDVFNFVIVFAFLGFFASLMLIWRIVKIFLEKNESARHDQQVSNNAMQNLVLKSQENSLLAINALMGATNAANTARGSLEATTNLISSLIDTTLPAMQSERHETEKARQERDTIYAQYRQTFDLLHSDIVDMSLQFRTMAENMAAINEHIGKQKESNDEQA